MKKNYLLPAKYARLGWVLLPLAVVFLVLSLLNVIPELSITVLNIFPDGTSTIFNGKPAHSCSFLVNNEVNDEIATVLTMLSLLLIAFSAERDEDEYTDALRLRSWFLAGLSYGVLYILFDLLVYGTVYLFYMWFAQGGILLLLYIMIFKVKLYRSRRACDAGQ